MSVLTAPWFYWSVIIAVGLPTILVLLTELQHKLKRRGSALARPVGLLRTVIVPLGALLLLLFETTTISLETTGIRMLTTVLGICILAMALSGVSATVFEGAPTGSWRRRMPSIFVDVARFAIIAVGVAMIFAYVWGANVGGLFTALGISSIVLGLTLQNSVGQIISGLLLLFEQPFQLGDWVKTTAATRPGGRSELAGNAYQHRQRTRDHPQLGTGRSGFRQPQPARRWVHDHRQR